MFPLLSASGSASDRNDRESPASPVAEPRAEPDFNGSGPHSRTAVYDFSNTFMFARWSVVMETDLARLMKDIHYMNDTWTQRAPMPDGAERGWHVAVWDFADNIAIVEGGYFKNGSQDPVYSQPLCTYDPSADAWTSRGQSMLPTASAGAWDSLDRCLLVCGGYEVVSGVKVIHAETWAWFPSNGTWTRLADLPAPRLGQCAVYDPDGNRFLVFGGTNGSAYFSDVWAYDCSNNTWTNASPVADELPLPRAYSSAVWNPLTKEMLVHGGENAATPYFLSTWGYVPANNTWIHRTSARFVRSMQAAAWNPDREAMTVVGAGAGGNNDTWTYDSASDSFGTDAPLPGTFRSGSAGVYDTVHHEMLVIGGLDPQRNPLNETWAFVLGDMQWKYFSPGYMQPPILDLGPNFARLDKVSWTENVPAGTATMFKLRTSLDNVTSTSWEYIGNGDRPSRQGRYVEWNMSLVSTADYLVTPAITGVRFDYSADRRPDCSAGDNVTAFKRTPVTLRGSGSDPDNDALTYRWTKASLPAGTFDNDTFREPAYTPLASGAHVLQLIVSDSLLESPASQVTVTVVNRPPLADAGPDQTGLRGENITLQGSASDPDDDALFLNWTQLAGPKVELAGETTLDPAFTAPRSGAYGFRLKADDGENATFSTVNVTVLNRQPLALLEAAPAQVHVNERVNFSAARSSDPDGNVTKWSFDFGDGNGTGWTMKPAIGYYYTAPGVYNATARVMDDEGNISEGSPPVRVTVVNALPVVEASVAPAQGDVNTRFTFKISPASYDPDGSIVLYEWSFGDGASGAGAQAEHAYSRPGNFTVTLRATDNLGGATELTLSVSVVDMPPVIQSTSPGKLFSMASGKQATFAVQASDPEGAPLTYTWTVDGRAAGGNASSFAYKPAGAGDHTVGVSVSDGRQSVSFEWGVSVKAAASAGASGPDLLLAGIVATIIVLMAVAVALAVRRTRAP
jgi:hypothetical protein